MINPETQASSAQYPQTQGVHVHQDSDRVLAAGGILWKVTGAGLRVLIIHRPRYDDWSWPKGKLDSGESLPECAVREIFEEIGIRGRLGLPLPSIHYPVSAGPKAVYYWAMNAGGASPKPDGDEVDKYAWVSPADAKKALTNPSDVVPLEYLEAAHADGMLETTPLVITRHAKAKPRSKWARPEADRPLAPSGFRQAKALVGLMDCWSPQRISSSPWTRCVQTMQPYAAATGARIKLVEAFTERAATDNPEKAKAKLRKLLRAPKVTAYCGHRPVMPLVLEVLREASLRDAAQALPTEDPYLRPGAVLIAHLPASRPERIIAFELHEPFDD